MSESQSEFQGELPVGVVEAFSWTSWRSWALFFGSAILVGGFGACLAVVIGVLESRSTGILETVIKTVTAALIGYFFVFHLARRLVAIVWADDLLDERFIGRANLCIGFRNRDDYFVGLIWLCCTPTVMFIVGLLISHMAGFEMTMLDDGMVLAIIIAFGAWDRILDGILKRAAQSAS